MHYTKYPVKLTLLRNLRSPGPNRDKQPPLVTRPLATGRLQVLLLIIRGLVSASLRIKRKEWRSGALNFINSCRRRSRHCRLQSTTPLRPTKNSPLPLGRIRQFALFYILQAIKTIYRPGRTSRLLIPLRKQALGPDIARHKLVTMMRHLLLVHHCMQPLQTCRRRRCTTISGAGNGPPNWTARVRVRASKASLRMQS